MPEIEDIIETTEKSALLLWWQWALVLLVVLILFMLIKAWIKRKPTIKTSENYLESALVKLKSTEQKDLSENELATELSSITRSYLERKFNHQALFQTQQEFSNHSDLEKLPETSRKEISNYLKALANHKYSPKKTPADKQQKLIQLTETLLRSIHSSPNPNPSI